MICEHNMLHPAPVFLSPRTCGIPCVHHVTKTLTDFCTCDSLCRMHLAFFQVTHNSVENEERISRLVVELCSVVTIVFLSDTSPLSFHTRSVEVQHQGNTSRP